MRKNPPADGPIDELKLYVGNIAWFITESKIQEVFSEHGDCQVCLLLPTSCFRVQDTRQAGGHSHYGQLFFATVRLCLEASPERLLHLERETEYSRPWQVNLVKNKYNDRPKGFGFVTFQEASCAAAALSALNGKVRPNFHPSRF